ncbi:MAG: hypothetical protein AB1523_12835 [Bacillota bacterium]
MVHQTEEIYQKVLGFYPNVIHDNLDKLPEWDRIIPASRKIFPEKQIKNTEMEVKDPV